MTEVYTVYFTQYIQTNLDAEPQEKYKIIGIFPSITEAERAIEQQKEMLPSTELKVEFSIGINVIDRIEWSEGFISVAEAMELPDNGEEPGSTSNL